jgi:hypothetical protein
LAHTDKDGACTVSDIDISINTNVIAFGRLKFYMSSDDTYTTIDARYCEEVMGLPGERRVCRVGLYNDVVKRDGIEKYVNTFIEFYKLGLRDGKGHGEQT